MDKRTTQKRCKDKQVADVFQALKAIRVPLIVTIVVAAGLTLADQSVEVFRAIAQDFSYGIAFAAHVGVGSSVGQMREFLLAALGLAALGLTLWYFARIGLLQRASGAGPHQIVRGTVHNVAVPLLAAVPLWAGAVGLLYGGVGKPSAAVTAALDFELQTELGMDGDVWAAIRDDLTRSLMSYRHIELAATLALLGTFVFALCLILNWRLSDDRLKRLDYFRNRTPRLWVYGLLAGFIVLLVLFPIGLPTLLGAILIFSLFAICASALFGQVAYWADQSRIPYLSGLFVGAIVIGAVNLNDNHRLRSIAVSDDTKTVDAAPTVGEQFKRWFNAREKEDVARYAGSRYPIYVVAAQGGGMYAAYHTAAVLGSLVDECPYFAHHLFAISAVSGGSIGAAAFVAVTSQGIGAKLTSTKGRACASVVATPPDRGSRPLTADEANSFADMGTDILDNDYLAPLFAGFLFPDFLQRFIPIPIPAFDRARFIEKAFEQAWTNKLKELEEGHPDSWTGKQNILSKPFVGHWNPEGSTPALVLNTTEVSTGQRRVIAPFVFGRKAKIRILPIWNEEWSDELGAGVSLRGVPLSAAAVASARFPWVTPAAWFDDVVFKDGGREALRDPESKKLSLRRVQVVDGGYYDNSGVLTAVDLIHEVDATAVHLGVAHKIEVHLIILNLGIVQKSTWKHATEVKAPISALLNARSSQGEKIVDEASQLLSAARVGVAHRVEEFSLADIGYELPLGWRLSEMTRTLIYSQRGHRERCPSKTGMGPDCAAARIYDELQRPGGASH